MSPVMADNRLLNVNLFTRDDVGGALKASLESKEAALGPAADIPGRRLRGDFPGRVPLQPGRAHHATRDRERSS